MSAFAVPAVSQISSLPQNYGNMEVDGGQFDDPDDEEFSGGTNNGPTSAAVAELVQAAMFSSNPKQEYDDDDYGEYNDDGYYSDPDGDLVASQRPVHGPHTTVPSTRVDLSVRPSGPVGRSATAGNHTGRDDRATSEQCLDPRTRLILFKMLNGGFLERIDGCLSTGKEANVYYGAAGRDDADGVTEYAIKIYKTSILVFRDRDKYVQGEHRWRHGYCKSNPRKMVKVWAEKEMRNYRRIYQANIPCPKPVLLKSHVLVMEFLGRNGWPSPRLRDAGLNTRRLREAYVQTLSIMRKMFRLCKLVHGDLSEYNMLWHEEMVYVIDVSQSVESDHPRALDFLRADCANVNGYFRKAGGLDVMTTRQLFEFVTDPRFGDSEEEESRAMDNIMAGQAADEKSAPTTTEERRREDTKREVDEAVFMSQFIPRSLNQVADSEIRTMEKGQAEESFVKAVAAMTGCSSGGDVVDSNMPPSSEGDGEVIEDNEGYDETSSQVVSSEEVDDEEDETGFVKVKLTPEEHAAARKAVRDGRKMNKKVVREEKATRRTTKIKKKDKKRAINKNKKGNK
mmetsp:Transcript_38746/g.75654  ORF Transcript_38746/g.75654 Transcript_38746/m.75654 type:complete len:566 (+) Transcript_38746:43-1740(+)